MRHFEFSLSTSFECIKKYSSQTFEYDFPIGMTKSTCQNGIAVGLSDYARNQIENLLNSQYVVGGVEKSKKLKK